MADSQMMDRTFQRIMRGLVARHPEPVTTTTRVGLFR